MSAKRISMDKTVPAEVWENIFSNLYPSQLARLSLVSRTFYGVVSSLPIWTRLFASTHPGKELRILRGRSASACCMIYMCAVSLHFCESCEKLLPFQQDCSARLPMPVLVTLPKTSIQTTTLTRGRVDRRNVVGNMINIDWRIRKCFQCRDHTSSADSLESMPPRDLSPDRATNRAVSNWEIVYPQLIQTDIRRYWSSATWINKVTVMGFMHKNLGGPAGVEAGKNPVRHYDAKTWSRIVWYQTQE